MKILISTFTEFLILNECPTLSSNFIFSVFSMRGNVFHFPKTIPFFCVFTLRPLTLYCHGYLSVLSLKLRTYLLYVI